MCDDDDWMCTLHASLHDDETAIQLRDERSFLGALEGGFQVPIGAVTLSRDMRRTLYGFIADIPGRRIVRGEHAVDDANPELSGIRLANELRGAGASQILEGLRRAEQVPAPQPE